jgi:hypothetical protein
LRRLASPVRAGARRRGQPPFFLQLVRLKEVHMLDRLELVSLRGGPRPRPNLALGGDHAPGAGAALVQDDDGDMAVVEGDLAGLPGKVRGSVLAVLRILPRRQAAAPPEAVVVPAEGGAPILLNGIRPLGLGVLGPGDVLSVGGENWLAVRRFRAEPGPAPPEVASKSCPVCGMALSLAACAMHHCGVFMHFSGGGEGSGDLDCYVRSSTCTACGGTIAAGEELIPDPAGVRWREDPVAGGCP